MNFVIFGLTVSSSWGNGHATLWRGLLTALSERGHHAIFYEKNVPYYAQTRDGWNIPQGVRLRIYDDLLTIRPELTRELATADVAIVTSYCADGALLSDLVLDSSAARKVFYDLDTPVTLEALHEGNKPAYLPSRGLVDFDLVLSFTGGRALSELRTRLGARRVAAFYGWVDPRLHRPAPTNQIYRSDLSYLGTYAADRQRALEELFVKPAYRSPHLRFVIGGAQYPDSFPWNSNIYFVQHLPPSQHPAFFCSGRATLNITRGAMARFGFCPSGRLFEAAACGAPILSDRWEGLSEFFRPGSEIITVGDSQDVLAALTLGDSELRTIAEAGRANVLDKHSAGARAVLLETLLETAEAGKADVPAVTA